MRRGAALALVAAVAAAVPAAAPSTAGAAAPDPVWQAAQRAGERLFDAQDEALLADRAAARRSVRAARTATAAALAAGLATADPAAATAARTAIADAARAAGRADPVALAGARGRARAALLRASATAALAAAGRGDARAAGTFLLLRDFRTATRFTRPGVDATRAVDGLAAGRVRPAAARLTVAKDLLDAYQAKLRELLDDAAEAAGKGFRPRTAASSAQAAGYWGILRDRYRQDLGAAATARADDAFHAYARAGARGDAAPLAAARTGIDRALRGFVAAPFTAAEEARRAQQLLRFVDLVPVEYGRGVKGRRVTLDFEIAEAVGFRDGAAAAFSDLQGKLARRDRARTEAAGRALDRMKAIIATAQRSGRAAPEATVKGLADGMTRDLEATFPAAWKQRTDDADLDLVDLTLTRLDAAVSSGQWKLAEQARLEVYAFIEFGPELKLRSFDPGLAFDIEGLVWFGARGHRGLAELIAGHADREQFRPTRLALDETLRNARATLGEGESRLTVVTNAAILVFREGLEAVLILAAITASMVGVLAQRRRPVMIGAGLGLVASILTWMLAQLVLESLSGYGEKLEAVVGLVAIAVLLLVMNWFFHRGLLDQAHPQVPPAPQAAHRRVRQRGAGRVLVGAGARLRPAGAHERLPRGLRDRALPAVAGARDRRRDGGRGRAARPRADRRRRARDLQAPAQAALQADADRDGAAARLRARRDGRDDRTDAAGHRLAADHAGRRADPVLGRNVARRVPDVGVARRAGRRARDRVRLLRPGRGTARAAAAAARPALALGRGRELTTRAFGELTRAWGGPRPRSVRVPPWSPPSVHAKVPLRLRT